MFGMTISSSQAKTLVDFIDAEKANYIAVSYTHLTLPTTP